MKTTQCCVLLAIGLVVAMLASPAAAATYFQDDFESYTVVDFNADGDGTDYKDLNLNTVYDYGEVEYEATMTATGWTTVHTPNAVEISQPKFVLNTTDWLLAPLGGIQPVVNNPGTANGSLSTGKFMLSHSDWGPSDEAGDSGASHDLYSPIFSTVGSTNPWLHFSATAVDNDNYGRAVWMVDASADGGATWTTVYKRTSTNRSSNAKNPPAPVTYSTVNAVVGGIYGALDVDLTAVANSDQVQLRFRQYEPSDDWWFAIDDVVVNDVARLKAGSNVVFAEDFSAGLGAMTTGGSGLTWNTTPSVSIFDPTLDPITTDRDEKINNLKAGFAVVEARGTGVAVTDSWLMTPILDCSDLTQVVLSYTEEIDVQGSAATVLLMQDDGDGVAETTDTIVATLFTIGAALTKDEGTYYAKRALDMSAAAGMSEFFVAFRYQTASLGEFWAIDNIKVTDVPEPSTIALLLGAGLMGFVALRRRG